MSDFRKLENTRTGKHEWYMAEGATLLPYYSSY